MLAAGDEREFHAALSRAIVGYAGDRFNIEAKPPASSKSSKSNPNNPKLPPNEEQRQMLLALLADRFQLKYRRETKEGAVYFLVKSGKKLALEEVKDVRVLTAQLSRAKAPAAKAKAAPASRAKAAAKKAAAGSKKKAAAARKRSR